MNNWTKEEIALTRRAWLMYDMDAIMKRHNKFERVSRYVALSATMLVILAAIGVLV
jgi:uncharacterized protein YozE (UPF0346 family)